jgi:hypothetical protein
VLAASPAMRRVGEVHRAQMKKGAGEREKMGRRPAAFESARGGAVEMRRGRQGGRGNWVMHGENEKGGPSSDQQGTAREVQQWPTAARPRRARVARRVHTMGRCQVVDERGSTGRGSGRAERVVRHVGRPRKETGWAETG